MKLLAIAVLALLLLGCRSSLRDVALTSEQARMLALQLANERAATLYHCQPFQDGQPARLKDGHWIWREARGYGRVDILATVELAVDGSTNSVVVQVFDSQNSRSF